MIDKVGPLLKEYGWEYKEFNSPKSGNMIVTTTFSPEFDLTLKFVILVQADEHWLYASTHKLLKFRKSDEVALRFLEYNSHTNLVKWFTRDIKEEMYINMGFEIHKDDFNKDHFFTNMDTLTFFLDGMINTLKEKGEVNEDNFTRQEAITKESFESDEDPRILESSDKR